MSRLRVFPIVEGHGEERAIRILIQRIWTELLGQEYAEVLSPLRRPRTKLVRGEAGTIDLDELGSALELAVLKLGNPGAADPNLILILLDADEAPACQLGPALLESAIDLRADRDIACVLADLEYETWFVAGARSLASFLDLSLDPELPQDPERQGLRKSWIEKRFRGTKYSETVDQPRMTQALDLALCRSRSPSFDKLCRELEKRIPQAQ